MSTESVTISTRIGRAWARLVRCHELFDASLRIWERAGTTPAERDSVTLVG